MSKTSVQNFIKTEGFAGLLLVFVLIVAMVIANSSFVGVYERIVDLPIQIRIGQLNFHKPLLLWVNEGLMAVFFMLLALEMKREILEGDLATPAQMSLPFIAALGGIVVPALIYASFNWSNPATSQGWPIPTTTDVAFALGVVALLGKRVPTSLKVFLIALSIVDDVIAVLIIALFYTHSMSYISLLLGCLGLVVLVILNLCNVQRIAAYVLVGLFIWACVLKSGVHATLGGVALGLAVPLKGKAGLDYSPLRSLEDTLHPWVAYFILPIFVFANGGIIFKEFTWGSLLDSVPLGIAAGLFVGKAVGAFAFSFAAIKLRFASRPVGSTWPQFFGVCTLTGIGFTMSIFLGTLAFYGTPYEELLKKGVLLGSLCSAVLGVAILLYCHKRQNECT